MDKATLYSKENLAAAFRTIDTDGSGTITADEVRTLIGDFRKVSNQVWMDIVSEAAEDQQEISFQDFQRLMLNS
jgi:Ca2+-binding EF-hand superfamily protein